MKKNNSSKKQNTLNLNQFQSKKVKLSVEEIHGKGMNFMGNQFSV